MTLASWVETTPGFGLEHLPYGSFDPGGGPRLGVRVGDHVLDLVGAAHAGLVPPFCDSPNLGRVLREPAAQWSELRAVVLELLSDPANEGAVRPLLHALEDVVMRLPFPVGDFVDFYSSEAHATNVGRLFRPDAPPLLPNWKYLPVGYHGRSGTVVVTGTPIVRPTGQVRAGDGSVVVASSSRLDMEVEMGWVVGGSSGPTTVPIGDAGEHIFGFVTMNDWSARDIQAWEYVPLGPFLGKSFATSIAAWVTPLEALEPYRIAGPVQDPPPFPYLRSVEEWGIDVVLVARLTSSAMRDRGEEAAVLCSVRYAGMYWTPDQQLAHLTVNGATVGPGDLAGSGTISGWDSGEMGSLLEKSRNGSEPFSLPDGSVRSFLEDGDEVEITAATPDGVIVMGSVSGRIEPARRGAGDVDG